MAHEIALFWLILAGLLFFDNLVLVPAGGDHLRFGRKGKLRYDPGTRLEARRRDLVLLNPLNPFDRIALTQRCIGILTPTQWRSSVRRVKETIGPVNRLSTLGSIYLLILVLLAAASLKFYFGAVLLALAVTHGSTWLLAVWMLVRERKALDIGTSRISMLAFETLLVPGYLVNLGKRVWFKHTLELPALTLGLRQLKRMKDEDEQALYHLSLSQRLDEVAVAMGLGEGPNRPTTTEQGGETAAAPHTTLSAWLQEARHCLTTSAAAAGS